MRSRWATRACVRRSSAGTCRATRSRRSSSPRASTASSGMAGCDKSMPAMLMASARLDLPSILVYNGSILPGEYAGRSIDITSVFEAVGAVAAGTITEEELGEIETPGLPRRRRLRRHVHRQHDELDRRGARDEPARIGVTACHRPPPPRRCEGGRRGGRWHARAGHHAAHDHDQAGVRERHRPDVGARRFDERRAAPAGDRLRGGRRVAPRGLQPHRRPRPAHRRHEARRQVPHERSRPRRRRAGRARVICSTPDCSTATS